MTETNTPNENEELEMGLRKSSRESASEWVNAKAIASLERIDELDIGGILNEETERTRNLFLQVSFLNCVLSVAKLDSINFGGLDIKISPEESLVLFFFLLFVSFALGVSYIINYNSDLIAKRAKTAVLQIRVSQDALFFEEAHKHADDQLSFAGTPINRHTGLKEEPDRFVAQTQNMKKAAKDASEALGSIKKQFNLQRRIIVSGVWLVFIIAIAFQVVAAYISLIGPNF